MSSNVLEEPGAALGKRLSVASVFPADSNARLTDHGRRASSPVTSSNVLDPVADGCVAAALGAGAKRFSVASELTLDSKARLTRRSTSAAPRGTSFLRAVSLICTLGGMSFGFNMAVINGALAFIQRDLQLDVAHTGLVTGSMLCGAALGAFLGGHLSNRFGRKRMTLANACCFIVGVLASAMAPSLEVLLMARLLLGLAVGCVTATVPVFLAELAPVEQRAQTVSRNELMSVTGQLCSFVSNAVLGTVWIDHAEIWHWMLAVGIMPAVALLIGTWAIVPESPRWLISADRPEEALKVLKKIRENERQARIELEQVRHAVQEDRKLNENASLGKLLGERWVRHCLLVGLGIAACQQITGVNVIMFYGTEILRQSGFSSETALMANICNGLTAVVSTATGIWLLSRVSRRPMLITAQCGMIIVHVLIGLCQLFIPNGMEKGISVVALSMVFLALQQVSISPLTWLLLAELFPIRIRGLGISLCTLFLWLLVILVGMAFPVLSQCLGVPTLFFGFSGLNALGALFSWRWLPETRGKSLELLEQQLKTEDWAALKRRPETVPDAETDPETRAETETTNTNNGADGIVAGETYN